MTETWREIPSLPGYKASDQGRIKSTTRVIRCGGGTRTIKTTVLQPFLSKSTGYMQIKTGGRKFSVHRLVAEVWVSGYFDGACVDHINGIRDDNRPENLEWVTLSENVRRGFANGRTSPTKGRFSAGHPTSKPVISTCLTTGREQFWPAAMDAVRAGYDSSCISRCCSGANTTHKGMAWRYGVKWSDRS